MLGWRARRGNRHGAEAIAHNLNRRHQIVLNLELSRLDTQKRMLERYFLYEISLIRARQARLMYRQREVKATQPKTAPCTDDLREKSSLVFITSLTLEDEQRGSMLPVIQSSRESLIGQASRRKTEGGYGEEKKAVSAGFSRNQGEGRTGVRKEGRISRKNDDEEFDKGNDYLPPVKMVHWTSTEHAPAKNPQHRDHAETRGEARKDGKTRKDSTGIRKKP